MTILRSGSNSRYSSNWAKAFGGPAKPKKDEGKKTAVKVAAKTGAKKAKAKSGKK